ncbi:hypothetical protein GCM10023063_38820 [Arthrobacter methylotrophus]|uniref:Helix-turn-helix domain-containing protein n=1 Tax=Arthrobacter methylotrophus TaxID=121291 RepID=A0ABV5UTP4_9MICC
MIEGYGRSRRYVSGVVVLSRKDAFLLSNVLDKQAAPKALRGSNEDLIDCLRAIGLARSEFAAFINARKTAKKDESNQDLDKWLTPLQIADQLSITHSAIRQALKDGRLVGVKVDGRWRVSPSDLDSYKALRNERRTA